ncbi:MULTISPECIES: GIY-YIG nuclease family protein [unclassified Variovorax]|uniref:GIY-YIG nuclease family protein n=1 Tax=unclassified Variovorax TaxID=663243 RepID=UPI0013A58AF4|nr:MULTISPECIES: GIY-YIG nuclease family protein [unclassified Variovorax]
MSSRAKTIQIFLPSGDPQGIRQAEITTRIVRVIDVPRALLKEFLAMPEAAGGAVYFLFGDAEEAAKPLVYIGQTTDLKKRLVEHQKKKDFWQRVVVLLSRAESLTTTHSLYLERLCIQKAKEAGRCVIENDTNGNKLNTSKPLESECDELFDTGETLMSTLGFFLFEKPGAVESKTNLELYYCNAAGTDARGHYTAEGLVVLKGSKARLSVTDSFKDKSFHVKRQKLEAAGVLKQEGEHLIFTQTYPFPTPSAAAAIVVGNNMNGWKTWKNKAGKDLDSVVRQVT